MNETEHGPNGGIKPDPELQGALAELRALETSFVLARYHFAKQHGFSFDGARDEYEVLGYDRIITTRQYREEYERGGIAGRIVDTPPNATWRGDVELVEDDNPKVETEFEKTWKTLEHRLGILARLQRVDKLSTLSTYAVLLIGAPGELDTELPKGKPESLLYVSVFSGGGGPGVSGSDRRVRADDADCTIYEFDTDATSARFGLPKSYQLRRTDVASPVLARPVHWSRILHVAEGLLDNEVYGQPTLERVWNDLANLRKVVGGGAEAFWLRANQGMHLNVDKDVAPNDTSLSLESVKEQIEKYKHGLDRWIKTKGIDVNVLGSDVANFAASTDAIITLIAGAKAIPKRILTGSEMGELASSQDRDNWNDQVNGRQTNHAEPNILRPLVDRLIAYGYLPQPAGKQKKNGYSVRWSPVAKKTEPEKNATAQSMASVNSTFGEVVFTRDEVREAVDKAPLTPEQVAALEKEKAEKLKAQQEMMKAQQPVAPEEEEARAAEYSFSSTEVRVPSPLREDLLAFAAEIPEDALAPDGREGTPHVTVKYGLHTSEVADVEKVLTGFHGPARVVLGKLGAFAGSEHDVLFVEVDSPDLVKLNALICGSLLRLETSSYAKYVPHLTIAYLKPGLAAQYVGDPLFEGRSFVADGVVFSSKDGERELIPLRAAEVSTDLTDAEEEEIVRVLEEAIRSGATEVVEQVCGFATLGGPGSGNFGHAGRPGEVGGSTSDTGGGGSSTKQAAWVDAFGTGDPYVYHITSRNTPIESFKKHGIKPSKDGIDGPGVYMANKPEATQYYEKLDTGRLFRIDKKAIIEDFGRYPNAKDGLQYDEGTGEVILSGTRPIPPGYVEYRDERGQWRSLK